MLTFFNFHSTLLF